MKTIEECLAAAHAASTALAVALEEAAAASVAECPELAEVLLRAAETSRTSGNNGAAWYAAALAEKRRPKGRMVRLYASGYDGSSGKTIELELAKVMRTQVVFRGGRRFKLIHGTEIGSTRGMWGPRIHEDELTALRAMAPKVRA